MLSEEALLFLAALAGAALLILGVLDLLWPTRPRRPARRPPSLSAPIAAPATAAPAPTAPRRKRRSRVSPHARPHAGRPGESARPPAPAPWRPSGDWARSARPLGPTPSAPAAPEVPAPAVPGASEAGARPRLDPLVVDTCFNLYQDRHYAEVISVATAALEGLGAGTPPAEVADDAAALWSLVGLAKQALADDEGARLALEEAIATASPADRPQYERHLATLAVNAARAWLGRADAPDADDRVGAVRAALAWIDYGLGIARADAGLAEARAEAGDALWRAYTDSVAALLHRQDFGAARALAEEALAEPDCPAEAAATLRGLLAAVLGGEVGALTAQAIVNMQEARDGEAMAALARAEALLDRLPADALSQERRAEVDQRLWWAYTKLGIRRVDAGEYEDALAPLRRALRFAASGADRREETCATLATALGGVADLRARRIRRLDDEGRHDEALAGLEELRALLREGGEYGLSPDDLAEAHATVRQLGRDLGVEDRP